MPGVVCMVVLLVFPGQPGPSSLPAAQISAPQLPVNTLILVSKPLPLQVLSVTSSPLPVKAYHRPAVVMLALPQCGPGVKMPCVVLPLVLLPHAIASAPEQSALAAGGSLSVVKVAGPIQGLEPELHSSLT